MKEKKLLTLLQKKRGFFEAILEITESDHHQHVTEWLSNLEQKKVLLSCIEEVDREIDQFKDSFLNLSQEIGDELEELKKIVQKILHLDNRSLEKRKSELKVYDQSS